jgi:phosphate:Na+ symporter
MGSIVLLDLMGGVALLLWGLHMVRSGIMRAFGSELRRVLGSALRNRILALMAGIGVTAPLQSSTATGLLMTSFAARGIVELVPGLAVMLGANIGTTLIVQALSFDVSAFAPVCSLQVCSRSISADARSRATSAGWRSAWALCCSRCTF